MTTMPQIQQLSREEKLRFMEALWEDLSKDDASLDSPAWHREALQETEGRLASGEERILDWQGAKRELRKRFE
jgi:hypothetical protein